MEGGEKDGWENDMRVAEKGIADAKIVFFSTFAHNSFSSIIYVNQSMYP